MRDGVNNATTDLLAAFRELNRMAVDPEGIVIPHAVSLKDGGLSVHALAMTGPTASTDVYAYIGRVLVRERPEEIVFGLDRYTKEGQGVPTRDCLSVSHWDGTAWRFGVIAYEHTPARFDPIDWGNPLWIRMLALEMERSWGRIINAPHRDPSPAMALPLRVHQGEAVAHG